MVVAPNFYNNLVDVILQFRSYRSDASGFGLDKLMTDKGQEETKYKMAARRERIISMNGLI